MKDFYNKNVWFLLDPTRWSGNACQGQTLHLWGLFVIYVEIEVNMTAAVSNSQISKYEILILLKERMLLGPPYCHFQKPTTE
jgi:hypothetical protein